MVTYGEPLPTRPLGKNGPQVTAIGYGCMGLSLAYGPAKPDEERFKILDSVIESGCYFFDTSDLYGDNEVFIGQWLKKNPGLREKIFLATKFGITVSVGENGVPSYGTDGSPEYVRKSVNSSLEKLGVDRVDLYYVHRVQSDLPIEVTMRELKKLKEEGKIKHIGLSECSAKTIRRAHAIEPIAAVQLEYSPFAIEIEDNNILDTCRELGIAVVAYSPLGRGMVTGRYRSPADFGPEDSRSFFPRFSEENFPKNLVLVDDIKKIADSKNATPAQIALAWVLSKGEDFIPIPGSTRLEGLKENFGALKVELTDAEKEQITDLVKKCVVVGGRYPAGLEDSLFADTVAE